ncbi:MAG: zinc-finger domain-containing protein [Parvibaculaceae bacterium]
MASGTPTPKFRNDSGVPGIRIGAKEFKCMGASPPNDHPHVFLDMGDENEIVCPYCSTLYTYDESLGPSSAVPSDAEWAEVP